MTKLDSATSAHIVRDISMDIPINKSKIEYTAEALKFRQKIEAEWKAFLKKNPKARLVVPTDIEGLG